MAWSTIEIDHVYEFHEGMQIALGKNILDSHLLGFDLNRHCQNQLTNVSIDNCNESTASSMLGFGQIIAVSSA